MDPEELAVQLDADLSVKIGEEKGTRRIHRLFYSPEDHQCFVAIQDEKTRLVVTILPVDYYENLAWKISKPFFEEAERLVCSPKSVENPSPIPPVPTMKQAAIDRWGLEVSPPDPIPSVPPVKQAAKGFPYFRISAVIVDENTSQKSVKLGSWPSDVYEGSARDLVKDAKFLAYIQQRCADKIPPDSCVIGMVITLGKKGRQRWFDCEKDNAGRLAFVIR